jgi:hypothetical protein
LNSRGRVRSITVHFTIIIAFFAGIGTGEAKIVLPSGSIIEVDKATVEAVLASLKMPTTRSKPMTFLSLGRGLGVSAAMWENRRACFRSGPRHIRCFDRRTAEAMA